jgi:hypothetical protein
MAGRLGTTLLVTGAIVIASGIGIVSSRGVAQERPGAVKLAEANQTAGKKAAAPRTVTPRTIAPRTIAPRTISTPRTTTTTSSSRTVTSKQLGTQKTLTTKRVVTTKRTVTPKVVTPKIATPKVITPKTSTSRTTTAKTVSPNRRGLRTIGASGTGQTSIRGRNYSVWRGSHRVRHDGRWATLAAISALSVIVFGGADYYPYAYISATGPYCEGVTEDGCVLEWNEVPTLEGPRVFQCVAYCPWQ